ncbi:MAG: NAD-dependent epimerase/dehydratase family protein, partial [Pirellulales bacterium]|nr:NAD-dependent epimerase/dehydratase family protein [Pirellulales bacterium]
MKVIIFGAGGYLGGHVIETAVAAGHQVTAAVRDSSGLDFRGLPLNVCRGDCGEPSFVHRSLAGQEAAIFCAGRTWAPGVPIEDYRQVGVSITNTFLEAARSYRQLRIVFTSSMATIGGTDRPVTLTETSGRDAVNEARLSPYDQAKIECESLARQAADRGQAIVILNPGLMIGPGAECGSNMAAPFISQWVMQGKCPILVDSLTTFCDVRDVAAAHVAALTQG